MPSYSDNPDHRAAEERCVGDVARFGLQVLMVAGDSGWPEFAYSVGLFHSYGHPEVIVLGLPGDRAHRLLNLLADEVRAGASFAAGVATDRLLEGYSCTFRPVPPPQIHAHFGWAHWYYDGKPFPALQLVWPDRLGRPPWDPGTTGEFRALQPLLDSVPVPAWAR